MRERGAESATGEAESSSGPVLINRLVEGCENWASNVTVETVPTARQVRAQQRKYVAEGTGCGGDGAGATLNDVGWARRRWGV